MSGFLGGGGSGSISTPVTVPNGGTGLTTITDHAVMIGSGVNPVTPVGPGTNGQLLIGSTGADPVFAALTSTGSTISFTAGAGTLNLETGSSVLTLFITDVAGPVTPLAGVVTLAGGNNITTDGTVPGAITIDVTGTTDHAVQVGNASGSLTSLGVGATNQVLLGNTGADPTWGAVDLTTDVTGILPVPNGGTGVSSITDHALVVGSGVGAVTPLAAATDGQIPIGSTGADPTIGSITTSGGSLVITPGAGTLNMEASTGLLITTGFEAWAGGAPYFDDTTLGSFTVSQGGTGYIKGVSVTWAGGQTTAGMTAGNTYYIYIDNTGTIGKTTTYSETLFENNIVLFECLRDSTVALNVQQTVKENHPYQFPWSTSVWAHDTIGSVISNMTGGANITLNGTQKIEISGADELEDHGLETTIPDSGGVAETFEQYFTLGSGKWARHTSSDTFDGTWNSGGTPVALGANKYAVYRLYVGKDDIAVATPTYWAVLGDAQYNNLASAQTAVASDVVPTATGELAMLELAQLGYIIFEESSTSIVDVIISKETLRTSFSGVTATTASLVLTDTTNFDHILSAADTTVQSALETIDDVTLAGDAGTAQAASAVFTIAGGTNVTTSAAGSTVTINSSGGGLSWSEVTGTTQAAAVNNGYICNNASQVAVTLPDTAAVGSVVRVTGKGAGGWRISQNAGETITWDESTSTTTGAGGYLESSDDYDSVELICITADTLWGVLSSKGNITIV